MGRLGILGLASYAQVHDEQTRQAYLRDVLASNAQLRSEFGPLFARVCDLVEQVTGHPAALTTRYAIPGFHVIDPFTYVRSRLKRPHFDVQYMKLDPSYRWESNSTRNHLSLTVMLAAPPDGSFIEYFGLDLEDELYWQNSKLHPAVSAFKIKVGRRVRFTRRKLHRYVIGRLLLTVGMPYHRIGVLRNEARLGERISLQGHGLLRRGTWELYW